MYKKFIETLCERENLIDVGCHGKATQSSLSKWSKQNDAMRSLSNNDYNDFAFHTDKEHNPWWMVEFKNPIKLFYIIINNRKRKPFDQIASTIEVWITDESDNQVCIHKGNLLFGSIPDSLPLILPLLGNYLVKSVKIVLPKTDYLHLCNIQLFRKKPLYSGSKRLRFFAVRTDGFGERLRAILHAMYLANKHEGDFYFSWQSSVWQGEFHAIDEVSKIFGKQFITQHYIENTNGLNLIDIKNIDDIFDEQLLEKFDGVVVQQGHYVFNKEFKEIEFSKNIGDVVKKYSDIVFPGNIAAIHLRTGDIVYGKHRFSKLFYQKLVPTYIIPELIHKLKEQGLQVILFGQDAEFIHSVSQKYQVLSANDFLNDIYSNATERALAEIVLMSRCDTVIAEHSGFAIVSSLIRESKHIKRFTSVLSQEEIVSAFQKAILSDGILNKNFTPTLLKAISLSHFVEYYGNLVSLDFILELLKECVSLDPENYFYTLLYARYLYRKGLTKMADDLLFLELSDIKNSNIEILAKRFDWKNRTPLSYCVDDFKQASQQGSILASIIVMMHEYYYDKKLDVEFYQTLINNAKEDALGINLLQQKLNQFSQ